MKNLTPKRTLLYGLFLLIVASYSGLHAAKSAYQPIQLQKEDSTAGLTRAKRKLLVHGYCRTYDIPKALCWLIIYFVHDNPRQYKNKPLPHDLSEQDLSGFDFTGCAFTYTNLTYTYLTDVILTNTTCDYQKAFLDNIKKNKCSDGNFYQENLPEDLKSIAAVYPNLNNNTHKAKLLHIACSFSRLPFYKGVELHIKVKYWSCALLQLKQVLGNPYGQQLVCTLENDLTWDASEWCWTTYYIQDKVDIATRAPHTSFDKYIKDFINGLTKYRCKSMQVYGFNWYKDKIIKTIKGLKKVYLNIKDQQLQQVACDIAHALSKSYQIGNQTLLSYYLFYQQRFIWLKKSVGVGVKNKVYYNRMNQSLPLDWSRSKK